MNKYRKVLRVCLPLGTRKKKVTFLHFETSNTSNRQSSVAQGLQAAQTKNELRHRRKKRNSGARRTDKSPGYAREDAGWGQRMFECLKFNDVTFIRPPRRRGGRCVQYRYLLRVFSQAIPVRLGCLISQLSTCAASKKSLYHEHIKLTLVRTQRRTGRPFGLPGV